MRKLPEIEKVCPFCHRKYFVKRYRQFNFCSITCFNHSKRGVRHTDEHRRKLTESRLKGKPVKVTINCIICGKEKVHNRHVIDAGKGKCCSIKCGTLYAQSLSPLKKGVKRRKIRTKDVNFYQRLHHYIRKTFGKPNMCEHCKITTGLFDWANKSGEYKKDRQDWLRLCRSCHRKYDW